MSVYFYFGDVRDCISEKVKSFALDGGMIETEVTFEGVSAVFCGLLEISLYNFNKVSFVLGLDRLLSDNNLFIFLNVTNKMLWFYWLF